jgi:small multidrug resistance pump
MQTPAGMMMETLLFLGARQITQRLDLARSLGQAMEMNPWLALTFAILFELSGTIFLKLSAGFTRPLPSIGVVCFYIGSFTLMAQSLKTLEVGIVYAIWSGVGTAMIAMVGVFAFGESVTAFKILGLLMIIGGSVLLRVASTQS